MKTEALESIAREASLAEEGVRGYTAGALVRLGARFVPNTLRYLGVPEADLRDVVQDVFVTAVRRLCDFEDRSPITPWLYSIAVRVAQGYRRRSRSKRTPGLAVRTWQEPESEHATWQRPLCAILDQLDEGQRAVFVLYEIERLNMKDVAEALGCPLQAAYSRHKVARTRVLEAFGRYTAEMGS